MKELWFANGHPGILMLFLSKAACIEASAPRCIYENWSEQQVGAVMSRVPSISKVNIDCAAGADSPTDLGRCH